MVDYRPFPAADLTAVVVAEVAPDGVILGDATATEIRVAFALGQTGSYAAAGGLARLGDAAITHLTVPAALAISVELATGDLQVSSIDGDVRLDDVRGDLHLQALRGAVTVARAAGNIRAEGVANLHVAEAHTGEAREAHRGGRSSHGWEEHFRGRHDPHGELSSLGERIRAQVSASLAASGINIETGEFTARMGRRGGAPKPPPAPRPSSAPERSRPSSMEERVAILKMLEEGKITLDEAESLLSALGG